MQREKIYDIKKRTFIFSLNIIKFLENLRNCPATHVISNQLLRSATSIGANIIEAQASPTKKDFANFYNHALKSANESKYWLMLLQHSEKCDILNSKELLEELTKISNILAKSLLTMRGK